MSMMTMVTRIIPSSASPDSYEALPHISDLCRGSKIHVNTFTEPKTGVSYQIETAFVEMKVPQESVKEMQKQIADHCESQQGMTCIKKNGLRAVQDFPIEITSSAEGDSPSNHLQDMEVNSPSNREKDVEILRCSVEQNVFLLSIANSIPQGSFLNYSSDMEIVYNVTSSEEKESRVSNFPTVQIELIVSKTNLSANNSIIATEMQTIPSAKAIQHHTLSFERSSGSSQESTNQDSNWYNFNNLKTVKKVLTVNNKIHIHEVPKENLITISKETNLQKVFKNIHESGNDPNYLGSEMFELMKKFVDNKCLICGFESTGKNRKANRHMLVHAKQRPFKCHKCDMAFVCKARLESHKVIHENKFPFSCKHCDKRFRRVGSLKQHEIRHTKTLEHKCDVCDKRFALRADLKKHLLTHTGERPFVCNICGKAYTRRNRLKVHIMRHSEDKPHKCEDCGKSFKLLQYLRIHRVIHQDTVNNKIHILEVPKEKLITVSKKTNSQKVLKKISESGNDPNYVGSEMFELMKKFVDNKCLICGFESTGKNRKANRHMLVHAKQRPFKCHKCDMAFVCKRRLKSHKIIHENKFPFSCKHCDKRFRRVGSLKQHEIRHTKTLGHKCDVCDKGFALRAGLKTHLLTHTGERPFVCNICGKAYSGRNRLKAHIMRHSEDKPHKCEDCGKSFKLLQYLRVHRVIHQDNKKYQCNICQQKFNYFSNLAQHKLTHSENRDHYCDQCDKKFKRPHHLRQHLATHSQKS